MNKRDTVKAVLLEIVNEVAGPVEHLDDDQLLVDQLGLESLHLARLVAVLEMELDTDPFSDDMPITGVRTVGDLLQAYDPVVLPRLGPASRRDTARARRTDRHRGHGRPFPRSSGRGPVLGRRPRRTGGDTRP